jgi:hypothetical protein
MTFQTRLAGLIVAGFLFLALGAGWASADTLGEHHTFFTNAGFDVTGRASAPVTLEYVSAHAYFYIEDAYLNTLNSNARANFDQQLTATAQAFDDNIYPKETAFWGSEENPGIDNDPRITVMLESLIPGAGGYFDSANEYPLSKVSNSNQREMLVISIPSVSIGASKVFLAHEFQHLISFNLKEVLHNVVEDTWLNEVRSQYAVTVAGHNDDFLNSDLRQRVQTFLSSPTDSLTEWPDNIIDYASATLLGHYLVGRFGPGILADTGHSSATGIDSINQYLTSHGNSEKFADVFADWVWANYFNNYSFDNRYGYANSNLQSIRVAPTNNEQLSSLAPNTFSYSLKPWQPAWDQFRLDSTAPAGSNLKISWQGTGFQIYYADASGVEHALNNGDIITSPSGSAFLLMPVNSFKTTNFGAVEAYSALTLSITYTTQPPTPPASAIHDGSLIMHTGTPDIYVVWGPYKRYLAPAVLKFYGLDASQAVTVPEAVFQSYKPSNYIRAVDEKKVYAVWPDGTKHWLNMTAQHFTDSHRDWNSVFIVNSLESSYYKIGPDITQ